MNSPARVDHDRCRTIATILGQVPLPHSKEETPLPPGLSRDESANLLFLQVAICHQTQALGGIVSGVQCRGWDYLTRRLTLVAERSADLVQPETWKDLDEAHLQSILFDSPEQGPIAGSDERVSLIRDLGTTMLSAGWSSVQALHDYTDGIIGDPESPGLLQSLRRFTAFSDPVQKKSFFFLGLMRDSGLWFYRDEEHLLPPVDYHEVRGHLRLGTVSLDSELIERIRRGEPVSLESDVAIRRAVLEAICSISRFEGRADPMTLHYFFWNIFRTVCLRQGPHCFQAERVPGLPERYQYFLKRLPHGGCGFASGCASAGERLPICEHAFKGHWY